MLSAQVEGQVVKVGDWVGFKSDIEQSGRIISISKSKYSNNTELTLRNDNGFEGDYIGGNTITTEMARDCWVG